MTTLNTHLSKLTFFYPFSPRYKVVVCRDLGPDVMPLLKEREEIDLVLWPEDRPCDPQWLLDNIPGASGVVVMFSEKITPDLLDKAGPSLRVVSTMSVGYEHIDTPALAQRGIKLGYTPDVLTDAVADVSILLALMAGRNGGLAMDVVKNSEWPTCGWAPFGFCGPQISTTLSSPSRTVGFIGFGRIAQATLARLIPFGITSCIYYSNPSSPPKPQLERDLLAKYGIKSKRANSLGDLAAESDIVFVLAPGGDKTKHLVDATFLSKMKKTAILVNASRGTLVDSDALAMALKEGKIWAAGLDVVEGEPNVTADHPLVREPRLAFQFIIAKTYL